MTRSSTFPNGAQVIAPLYHREPHLSQKYSTYHEGHKNIHKKEMINVNNTKNERPTPSQTTWYTRIKLESTKAHSTGQYVTGNKFSYEPKRQQMNTHCFSLKQKWVFSSQKHKPRTSCYTTQQRPIHVKQARTFLNKNITPQKPEVPQGNQNTSKPTSLIFWANEGMIEQVLVANIVQDLRKTTNTKVWPYSERNWRSECLLLN